jgi:lipoprotein-anchoring transpeptidase ErfK/SrfK
MNCTALSALLLLLLLSSCAIPRQEEIRKAQVPDVPKTAALYEWVGGVEGPSRVTISLGQQKAKIYRQNQQVGWTYVASGKGSYRTPKGSFRIIEKTADKRSNLWGKIVNASGGVVDGDARAGREAVPAGGRFVGASMPHWMRLTNSGIGLHGGPIPNPGYPASHGCIRLPFAMARILFAELPMGTPVVITD